MKFIIFLAVGRFLTLLICKENGFPNAIIELIASIAQSIVSSFLYDNIKSLLFKPDNPTAVTTINDESINNNKDDNNSNLDDNESYM